MKKERKSALPASLREKALLIVKNKSISPYFADTDEKAQDLILELELHQIELELQNEELRQAQTTATRYAERYLELYDFAPIGYLTLSKEGAIIEINLCASMMLERDRSQLIKSQLGFFISNDSKPVFNHFLWKIFTDCNKEKCEVILECNNKTEMYVRLTGIIDRNKEQCLVTVMDITEQKQAEAELEKWATIFKPKAN